MAKSKLQYQCSDCGALAPKWAGQCADCGAWNSMSEALASVSSDAGKSRFSSYTGQAGAQIQDLGAVQPGQEVRVSVGVQELDRVLGGGLVAGSVVLIGGDPGIGKSTLLLQALASFPGNLKALYVTGEESPEQVSLRARRLEASADNMRLLAETSVERIIEHARIEMPKVMVIDSIQTLYTEALQSAPGSVGQVRESAAQLVRFAKQTGTA
ncbi:DNA repair protein RadA, partial [hydrothermal vent metagenome]